MAWKSYMSFWRLPIFVFQKMLSLATFTPWSLTIFLFSIHLPLYYYFPFINGGFCFIISWIYWLWNIAEEHRKHGASLSRKGICFLEEFRRTCQCIQQVRRCQRMWMQNSAYWNETLTLRTFTNCKKPSLVLFSKTASLDVLWRSMGHGAQGMELQ